MEQRWNPTTLRKFAEDTIEYRHKKEPYTRKPYISLSNENAITFIAVVHEEVSYCKSKYEIKRVLKKIRERENDPRNGKAFSGQFVDISSQQNAGEGEAGQNQMVSVLRS
jgi:hypothetical protein